jgi:hypothetical protein
MRRLIPYPALAGETSLEVCEARLDGIPLHLGVISTNHRVVALHQVERGEWEEARLTVRLNTPRKELESGGWSDITCVAVLAERRTRTRTVTPLRRDHDGTWTGVVVLHRDHYIGQVELSGHVVATVGEVAGRTIGSTERQWTVDLKARTPTKQSTMKIVSVDFADEGYPHLHQYKNDPWTVDAGADEPVVYLNIGFEGLVQLLNGGDRAVRDSLSAQIAADAWTALFNAATYAAETDEGEPQWPGGWKNSVLKSMLPDMFPDRSPDDALVEIVARRRSGEGGGDLQTRLLHAAGRQALTTRRLGSLIRMLNRKESA